MFWMLERLNEFDGVFLIKDKKQYSYSDLRKEIIDQFFRERFPYPGNFINIPITYSLKDIALLLLCINYDNIAVLSNSNQDNIEWDTLKKTSLPGIILYTSGTNGKPKEIFHNVEKLTNKYKNKTKPFKTIGIAPLNHMSGLDVLFYTLSSGGCLIIPENKEPHSVCTSIEKYKAELLPCSAGFLNWLVMADCIKDYDLSSLKIIAYGSDMMSENILRELNKQLPDCRLIQKYGTTEFGSPKTRSLNDTSTWLKFVDTEYKIIDDHLWLKFTDSDWIDTGDLAEELNGYIRILGRDSDIINVGGMKVYPIEIENTIIQMPEVVDVVVYKASNTILGYVVNVDVILNTDDTVSSITRKIRTFCKNKLPDYAIPIKVNIGSNRIGPDKKNRM